MSSTVAQRAMFVLLLLGGIAELFYGSVTPLVPPVIEDPVQLASWALALMAFAAAGGVARGERWGYALGMTFVTIQLVRAVGTVSAAVANAGGIADPAWFVTALLLGPGLMLVVLAALSRGWRGTAHPAH
jgi:hypothetical protein